jgi:type I restriction enzyme, S subunit
MKSNYKLLGDYIREVNVRNKELKDVNLLGVSIQKEFIPSIANTIGTNMSTYKLVKRGQFAYGPVTSRNGDKISIALLKDYKEAMISQAYKSFEVIDENLLLPEYLMMWFSRPEFDRYARFISHGSVREIFSWEDMCEIKLPIPSIKIQEEIVNQYKVIQDKIDLNNSIIQKTEEAAHTIYKQSFLNYENYDSKKNLKLCNYIETNPKLSLKRNSVTTYVELNDLTTTTMRITSAIKREFTGGSKFQNFDTLLARITPSLENGKTAFVDILEEEEIAAGSTEFIVMRAKENVSPYWVYCLARDENFRTYAISSMVGSSGRQRVHEEYLGEYIVKEIDIQRMNEFHNKVEPIFRMVKSKSIENDKLLMIKNILLSKLAK